MGLTTVAFRGRRCTTPDGALAVWLEILVHEIDEAGNPPSWLKEARDEWHLQATAGFGFGVMAGLDRIITNDEQLAAVRSLSDKAMRVLNGWDDPVSADRLNAMEVMGDAYWTEDLPLDLFREAGKCFLEVLSSQNDRNEIDSRSQRNPHENAPGVGNATEQAP